MTQDIDKSNDRLITSENLQQDAKHITALAGNLIAQYAALLDTDDHEVSVAAMVALSSLRKIAMRAHDMGDAGRSLAQADGGNARRPSGSPGSSATSDWTMASERTQWKEA